MEEIDIKQERDIINTFIPMPSLFDKIGIDYSLHSNMFCPFHDNENSPAAHYHSDSNRLWCYSEQKMFGSWNLLKLYYPSISTQKVALSIIEKYGQETIERTIESVEFSEEIPYLEELSKFKARQINYQELCILISEHYI